VYQPRKHKHTSVFDHSKPKLAENTVGELLLRNDGMNGTLKPLVSERDQETRRWQEMEGEHVTSRIKTSLAKSG
jgi:hypothetical protein